MSHRFTGIPANNMLISVQRNNETLICDNNDFITIVMDYRRAIGEMYPTAFFSQKRPTIVFYGGKTHHNRPTKKYKHITRVLKTEWVFIQMQFKRNTILVECDYFALPDYPNRDQWVVYRQLLRDLPGNWTIDTPFPQPPT